MGVMLVHGRTDGRKREDKARILFTEFAIAGINKFDVLDLSKLRDH